MQQSFKSLDSGMWFFPLRDDGTINCEIILIKLQNELKLTGEIKNLKLTLNSIKHGKFNAVIINSSPGNNIKGYLDYLPPDTPVMDCSKLC